MTAEELIKIINPEVGITAEQMVAIEQLTEYLPWFTCPQLLLLKAMKQYKHPFFEDRLAFASLYATSRQGLEQYLNSVHPISPDNEQNNFYSEDDYWLGDDGFELLSNDEVCEVTVDISSEEIPSNPPVDVHQRQNMALIDKFISQSDKIIPSTSSNKVSDIDLSAPFSNIPDDLISETLADIYVSQGLLDNAMQVYSKLSLLYPEKKAYFATRFATISHAQRGTTFS
ncbi:MAG: hypothetical protein LBH34_01210 [Prevotellaceae bacterium]|jgi:hypothetical protein|nr:hypothetical protein [Prevotellaceae bacterium]